MNTPERGLVRPSRNNRFHRDPEVYTLQIDIWEDVQALELVYRDNQDPALVARLWLDSHCISHPEAYEGLIRLIIRQTGGQVGGQIFEDTVERAVFSAAPSQRPYTPLELAMRTNWPTQDQTDRLAIQAPAIRTAFLKSEETLEERNGILVRENARLVEVNTRLMQQVAELRAKLVFVERRRQSK
ncbi:hypothetical protein LTR15_005970 [Elasticomyces elasticus]|nr:hypothetical protein LTR15_005970 [Elasticomyces elasticus]